MFSRWWMPYLSNFAYSMSSSFNSALNPLLYVWRIKAFRDFLTAKFRDLFRKNAVEVSSGDNLEVNVTTSTTAIKTTSV